MDTPSELEKAAALLAPWTVKSATPEANRLDVYLKANDLLPAVEALVKANWGYFAALTGVDQPPSSEGEAGEEGRVEALYHFCEGAAVVTLRVSVPYSQPELDSICGILPSATLYEREFIEMFGVGLRSTPSTERLLLADDWPDGVYPLRKSFTGLDHLEKEAHDGCSA